MISSACSPRRVCILSLAALSVSILGCSTNLPSTSPISGGQLHGNIHGGQQPVSGSSIQLYAAGTTGYGSNATALLSSPVVSDASGNFTITGDYTCPTSSSQLYIVATGGNPGLAAGTNNRALALMTALGTCSLHGGQLTLDPNSVISINEVTTVASVYALSAFMDGDATHVGTSSTNTAGLANSFQLVNNLVNTATGAALPVTPAGNGTPPQATINTLANIVASCVNSDGAGTACTGLAVAATPSGGTPPTNTIQGIFNVARNPANNVSALYALTSSTPPFQPTLPSAPNDWTLGVRYTTVTFDSRGNGPSQEAIAIDGSGDAWIANEFTTSDNLASSVAELSATGSILSGAAGYTGGGLNRPSGVAIDPLGNAWLTNSFTSTLTKLSNTGTALSGSSGFGNVCISMGVAVDGSGNVWCGRLAKFDNSGNLLSGGGFTGGGIGLGDQVRGLSVDPSENVWLAASTGSATSTVAQFTNAGVPLSGSTGYTTSGLTGAWSTANDSAGNAWVTNNGFTSSVYKFANNGTILSPLTGYTGGGLANPLAVAIDGAGNAWVTSDSVQTIDGTPTSVGRMVELNSAGTILSGATGYFVISGNYPVGTAIDGSGNVWLVMASNYVVELVGIATPVVTPLSVGLKNHTLGTRP